MRAKEKEWMSKDHGRKDERNDHAPIKWETTEGSRKIKQVVMKNKKHE